MRITNPTNRNTEARIVKIVGISLYFSYETLVGVRGHNGLRRVSESYSRTTRKHMKEMNIWGALEIDNNALKRYAETSIMINLMEEYLPIKGADNET